MRAALADEFGLPQDVDVDATPMPAAGDVSGAVADDDDALQSYFMEQASLDFVGRKPLLARLQEFADSDVQAYVVL